MICISPSPQPRQPIRFPYGLDRLCTRLHLTPVSIDRRTRTVHLTKEQDRHCSRWYKDHSIRETENSFTMLWIKYVDEGVYSWICVYTCEPCIFLTWDNTYIAFFDFLEYRKKTKKSEANRDIATRTFSPKLSPKQEWHNSVNLILIWK